MVTFVASPGGVIGRATQQTGLVQLRDWAAPAANVDTNNKPFGTTKGRPWPEWRPFYLHAINKDNTDAGLAFGLSPSPNLRISPSAKHLSTIGNQSTTGDPSDLGMLLLVSNATNYGGKPV